MLFDHSSAILLHPTSLPGPYGIGDLGPSAHHWLDWQAASGTRWWQILPLGPTGYADSPYASFSAFAGNPMLISPELLVEAGLLKGSDLEKRPDFPEGRVDYARVNGWKEGLLAKAFQALEGQATLNDQFEAFQEAESEWLADYALFMAIKDQQGLRPWWQWPAPLRNQDASALDAFRGEHSGPIGNYAFQQFLFFKQWDALRARMAELDLSVIGDMPIYVAHDSADVWANPRLFQLDAARNPTAVAGVPPDYFSESGQLWGNPLYAWERHKQEGYAWWLARLRAVLRQVDVLRLDHFRGFAGYWAVPAGAETAVNGEWRPGPAADFFHTVRNQLGELPIIAEDLGEITPDVIELRDQFKLPGMKILQFAFDAGMDHEFLPHNYEANCVAYTGTHDNDTTIGWYRSAPPEEAAFCRRYLDTDGEHIAWDMLQAVWASVASLAAGPMQDFLELGPEARMNYPGTTGGNWDWRLRSAELSDALADRIAALNKEHKR